MDKIFKNNTIMGIVAIATLALVVIMYMNNNKKTDTAESATKDSNAE